MVRTAIRYEKNSRKLDKKIAEGVTFRSVTALARYVALLSQELRSHNLMLFRISSYRKYRKGGGKPIPNGKPEKIVLRGDETQEAPTDPTLDPFFN